MGGGIVEDVASKIRYSLIMGREATGVFCDKQKYHLRKKGNFIRLLRDQQ